MMTSIAACTARLLEYMYTRAHTTLYMPERALGHVYEACGSRDLDQHRMSIGCSLDLRDVFWSMELEHGRGCASGSCLSRSRAPFCIGCADSYPHHAWKASLAPYLLLITGLPGKGAMFPSRRWCEWTSIMLQILDVSVHAYFQHAANASRCFGRRDNGGYWHGAF